MTEDPNHLETIPIVEATIAIDKRVVETGRVQVRTFVNDEQVHVTDALKREVVNVERVAIGREVEVAPIIREEGEFLIVPIVEERLVTETWRAARFARPIARSRRRSRPRSSSIPVRGFGWPATSMRGDRVTPMPPSARRARTASGPYSPRAAFRLSGSTPSGAVKPIPSRATRPRPVRPRTAVPS